MGEEFATASFSAIGRRNLNEDRVGSCAPAAGKLYAWAAADGLGGHDSGEVAAEAALDAALRHVEFAGGGEDMQSVVRVALEEAQAAVLQARSEAGTGNDMATTLALVVSDREVVAWGHAGDTRIYRLRDGRAELLTRDHTVAESMRRLAGTDHASSAPTQHSNMLISSIGSENPFLDVSDAEPLRGDDVFLLCTDGLWAQTTDSALVEDLQSASTLAQWLSQLQRRVELAGDPEQDNYSGIAFHRVVALQT